MGSFFQSIWNLLKTPMTLPWIGTTSPLYMMVALGLLSLLVTFLNSLWGNDGDD